MQPCLKVRDRSTCAWQVRQVTDGLGPLARRGMVVAGLGQTACSSPSSERSRLTRSVAVMSALKEGLRASLRIARRRRPEPRPEPPPRRRTAPSLPADAHLLGLLKRPRKNSSTSTSRLSGSRSAATIARRSLRSIIQGPLMTLDPELTLQLHRQDARMMGREHVGRQNHSRSGVWVCASESCRHQSLRPAPLALPQPAPAMHHPDSPTAATPAAKLRDPAGTRPPHRRV
jgi:hypothetical protein